MKEDFEIFEFNNREYVLIEKYNLNNQEIYFFLADEEELFCTMQNKKYIPRHNIVPICSVNLRFVLFMNIRTE